MYDLKRVGQKVFNTKTVQVQNIRARNCVRKEKLSNYRETEKQCPDMLLPAPSIFEYKKWHEKVRYKYVWASEEYLGKKFGQTSLVYSGSKNKQIAGFLCRNNATRCYGDTGYPFPNLKGYELTYVPKTSVYGVQKGKEGIPWIREENWDSETGRYIP